MNLHFKPFLILFIFLSFHTHNISAQGKYWNPGTTVKYVKYESKGDGPNYTIEVRYQPVKNKIEFSLGQASLTGYTYQGKTYKKVEGVKNLKDVKSYSGQDYLPLEIDDVSVDVEYELDYRGKVITSSLFICYTCPTAYCKCDIHVGLPFGMNSAPEDDKEYYQHVRLMNLRITKVYWGDQRVKNLITDMIKKEGQQPSPSSDDNSSTGNGSSNTPYTNSSATDNDIRSVNGMAGYEAYKDQHQNNRGSNNQAKTDLEKEQNRKDFHRQHVEKNNARVAESNEQNNSSTSGSTANRTSADYQNAQQRELEARAQEYKAKQAAFYAEIERKMEADRQRLVRVESATKQSLTDIGFFLQGLPKVRFSVSSIQSAQSPQQAFQQFSQIKRQLDRERETVHQNFQRLAANISTRSPQTQEEAIGNVATLAVGAIGTAVKQGEINKEKKKAEQAYNRKLNSFKKKLEKVYLDNYNAAVGQIAMAVDENVEKYYIQLANYWNCNYKNLNKSYSTSHLGWTNLSSSCNEPTQKKEKNKFTAADYLKAAERKLKYFNETEGKSYYEASKYMVDQALKKDNKYAKAYAFRAGFHTNVFDQYAELTAAHQIDQNDASVKKLLDKKTVVYNERLFHSIQSGDVDFIRKSIKFGFHTGQKNKKGETPLQAAITADKVAAFKLFYDDLGNNKNQYKNAYLFYAAQNDAANVAKYLIDKETVSPNLEEDNINVLEVAFAKKATTVFALLLEKGADIGKVDQKLEDQPQLKTMLSNMLLEAAVINKKPRYLKMAMKYGKPSADQVEDMMFASIKTGNTEVLTSMINILNPDDNAAGENSYVHVAIKRSRPEILQKLIEAGYDSRSLDAAGVPAAHYLLNSPFMLSSTSAWKSMDINQKDSKDLGMLHKTVFKNGGSDILNLLVQHPDVDINIKGLYGWTPLHYATRENNVTMVAALIKSGADISAKDEWGRTPWDIAKERKFKNLKVYLK